MLDSLTVRQDIGFPITNKTPLAVTRVYAYFRTWMEHIGLDKFVLHRLFEKLSDSMRKQASFSCAVIFDPDNLNTAPEIVYCEDPTAGLYFMSCPCI